MSTQTAAAATEPGRFGGTTPAEELQRFAKRLLQAIAAIFGKLLRAVSDAMPERAGECSTRSKLDVKVASPRKLFRSLHDFLEEDDYDHEYEPLKAERDAIGDTAIFKSDLMGTRDSRGRDWLSLIVGLLLVFTIVLIPVAIALLRAGSYKLRTVVEIGVEGEAYRYRYGTTGTDMTEWLDVISEARVTLRVTTGVAEGESEIARPSRVRGERRKIAREQDYLRDAFEQRLISLALPVF